MCVSCVEYNVNCILSYGVTTILLDLGSSGLFDQTDYLSNNILEFVVCCRSDIGFSTVSDVEPLDRLRQSIRSYFSLSNVEELDTAIHTRADDGCAQTLDL